MVQPAGAGGPVAAAEYRPVLIARLHKMGLQVHYWTINDEAEMERLIDAGADGLITDEVELLKSVLQRRNLWSTEAPNDGGR